MSEPGNMQRYARQMLVPDIGTAGQRRLLEGHAVIVGCGALGTAAADILARAGVGRLTLIDRDVVEPTNLQRQILFDEDDARLWRPKADAARRRLAAVNSSIRVDAVVEDFDHTNAERLCIGDRGSGALVLLDGTDNFETRYLINDLAVRHGVPFVYGGAVGTIGMSMTVRPGVTPCLRCVFPEPPPPGASPTCDTMGILASVSAMVGAYQASEAMKILIGRDDLCSTTLLQFDPWRSMRRRVDLPEAPSDDCPCCKGERFEFLDGRLGSGAVVMCGRNAVQIRSRSGATGETVDLEALARRLAPHGTFVRNEFLIRGRLASQTPQDAAIELTIFRDGRAIVHGTDDPARARAVYARYVGS